MTVVSDKTLLYLEPFHGSTLPLGSNPSSLAWPARLSLIRPRTISQATPLSTCHLHTACSRQTGWLSVLPILHGSSLPGSIHYSSCLEYFSYHPSQHPDSACSMPIPSPDLSFNAPSFWKPSLVLTGLGVSHRSSHSSSHLPYHGC